MNIGVYSPTFKPSDALIIQGFFDELIHRNINFSVFADYYHSLLPVINFPFKPALFVNKTGLKAQKIDAVFSIGGDGSFLKIAKIIESSNIPIIGFNIGRLGFLANVGKNELKFALDALLSGDYSLENRSLITLESQPALFGKQNFALNEFTIHKRDTSAMITIHTYIDEDLINSYWADGLIVATPTGSTAYSLSCGGPIILPTSPVFVLTPVAPHNLNVCPLIIPDNRTISFKVEGRSNSFLCTLDSRYKIINFSYQIAIKKANFYIKVIQLPNSSFFSTIRNKLLWGKDIRN